MVKGPPLGKDSISGGGTREEPATETARGIEERGVRHQGEGERFSRATQIYSLISTERKMARDGISCLLTEVLKAEFLVPVGWHMEGQLMWGH